MGLTMMIASLKNWKDSVAPWYSATGLASLVMGTSSVLIPLMIAEVLGRSVGAVGILSSVVSLIGVIGSLIWGGSPMLPSGASRSSS